MLLTKNSLRVGAVATKDGFPIGLRGILVEPNGGTVATDGHALMQYTPTDTMSGDAFPNVVGFNASGDEKLKPFIVPVDAADRILKAMPKKQTLPVLEMIALDVPATNANGHAEFAVTDLENPQRFSPAKIADDFPKYQQVIPKGKADVSFDVDAKILRKVLGVLVSMQGKYGHNCVTIEYRKAKSGEVPIVIRSAVSDGDVLALVMPLGK
jgi:DNA polymerase III sliding clamp (beta) subunit (PCNA family)